MGFCVGFGFLVELSSSSVVDSSVVSEGRVMVIIGSVIGLVGLLPKSYVGTSLVVVVSSSLSLPSKSTDLIIRLCAYRLLRYIDILLDV